jgi:hypothetical protein
MRVSRQPPRGLAVAILVILLLGVRPVAAVAMTLRGLPDGTTSEASATHDILDVPWLHISKQELLDLNQDGRSDAMRLSGDWLTSTGDTLTVYDHGGDMPMADDYRHALDFVDSTWVFDIGNRGAASLIVDFETEGEQNVAYLWDDQNGDGRVDYRVDGRTVRVTESPFWTMKVWTSDGWFREDGSLNYNLHTLLDGCGLCRKVPTAEGYSPQIRAHMPIDGQPDFAADLADVNNDGIPEILSWRMLTRISEASYELPRFGMLANEGRAAPAPPTGYLFWPLLAPSAALPEDKNYFATPPFIPIDWTDAKIDLLSVAGYPIENGFHINSYAYAQPDESPMYTNFESPMAYYDLAQDHDGRPELHVRVVYGGAHDPLMAGGRLDFPLEEIRYSWNQSNNPALTWDYKLGLAGRYAIDSVQTSGGLDVRMVPYDDLPEWVASREWDVSTLVAAQPGASYLSSEGLYDWSAGAGLGYVAGLTPDPPVYDKIRVGMRGEYSFTRGRSELYFDPIDQQLHLVQAQGGMWQLASNRQIRYLRLTPDPGFDGWQTWQDGRLISQLYRVPKGLIYSDQEQTLFLRADIPTELFHTLPPTNHAEWVKLGEQLASHNSDLPPGDLRAMFDQFGGTPVRIASGPLSDFHHVEAGVQFVIEADDVSTRNALVALMGTQPDSGPQVVTLVDDHFSVTRGRYVSPSFSIDLGQSEVLRESSIGITVVNRGTMAIDHAALDVTAVSSDGRRFSILSAEPVEVEGSSSQSFHVQWAARTPGNWTLEIVLHRSSGSEWSSDRVVLAQAAQTFEVHPTSTVSVSTAASLGWPGVTLERLSVLLGLAGLAGVIAMIGFKRQRRTA